MQLYSSALVFAPSKSFVRRQFEGCIPSWIRRKPRVQASWDAALQTLEGHSKGVRSVAFSPDGKQVVSGSYDCMLRLWDTATGAALQTLEGRSDSVSSVAFSPNGKLKQALFLLSNWVIYGRSKILWLPPDYRANSIAVWNRTIVLGHSSGRISCLGF
jgi:WD40 repeat protein